MTSARFDRYPRFDELSGWLREFADEYPDLVELSTIGESHEKRPLWLLTVTNRATGPAAEKPALWLDGNIHASEVTASVALVHLVRHLCTGYGTDPKVTVALDTRAFYVVPRVNPDGAELALAEVPSIVRSTTRPWPLTEARRVDPRRHRPRRPSAADARRGPQRSVDAERRRRATPRRPGARR